MTHSRLLTDVKSLAGKSVVYGLGSILLRSINFFLLPLYTRYLTPADYGIIAVTTTITAILGILYPLSLHGALPHFYYDTQNEAERRRNNGTIWVGIILASVSMTILLDRLGDAIFPLLFQEVPFAPYIRLAIWTAFFSVLALLPLNMFQIQERPGWYVFFSVAGTLLSIGLVIYLVVLQKQGAYGYLFGAFLGGALMTIPYVALAFRQVQVSLKWNILKAALIFSLPLLPHGLAGWVLELSDRVILERYVSLSELGLYALGYQLSALMNITATAINNAWVPFLFKTDAERGEAAKVNLTRLATYYVLTLTWVALGLALFARDALVILTAPAFHAAYRVMPWIIGGLLLSGLYYIPVNFLFLRSKTGWVPVVTVISGLVNVGLNLWLIRHYGIMAAAWATFVAYGVMLLLVWYIAKRVYPFPYEYRRLGLIGLIGVILVALGNTFQLDSVLVNATLKGLLILIYPIILALVGFFTPAEKETGLLFVRQTLTGLRKSTLHI